MTEQRETKRSFPLQVAVGYILVAGCYIVGSGHLAALLARNAEQLIAIEQYKGLGFVVVTGLLLYLLCRRFVAQVAAEEVAHGRTREALAAADRRTVPALLAASLAHDANNALGAVLGHLDLAAETPGLPQDVVLSLSRAKEAAQKVVELNRRMASSARDRAVGEPTRFDLRTVVADSLDLLRNHHRARESRLDLVPGPACPMLGHRPLIHQIIINLVLNAAEAGKVVRIRVETVAKALGLEVDDDGPGFPSGFGEHAFAAFQTTKVNGTGIGLFSVKHCAELHGGRVELGRSELGGARVSVWLPLEGPERPRVP